uniref:HTH psq-type domain-containing protein n=1 Tax=Anopheles minimus TaxID=112268 RepID=A0A182WC33_9DIPT
GTAGSGNGNNGGLANASTTNSNATTPQPATPVQIYQHPFSPQIISVNPNSMVNSYQSSNLSTPTSPQTGSDQTTGLVYSTGTPNQSPLGATTTGTASGTNASGNGNAGTGAGGNGATGGNGTATGGGGSGGAGAGNGAGGGGAGAGATGGSGTVQPVKRKRSVNPQGDENFLRALEAVRFGGIGFCKAARLYGVNNRTLWLEYKKRGYPISRPSIKNRIKLEPNISPPPTATTPPGDENASMEHYDTALSSPALNMSLQQQQQQQQQQQVQQHQATQQQQVTTAQQTQHQQAQQQQQQQGNDTTNAAAAAAAAAVVAASSTTPLMCPPHGHPMGVMGFLDTRHVDFTTTAGLHQMSRQRYPDTATVNMNTGAVNLQGLNFNSIKNINFLSFLSFSVFSLPVADMARVALGLVPGQSSSSTSSGASESSTGTGSLASSEQSTSTSGGHIVSAVAKRGRLLIRQQRIKKENDSSSTGQQPYEPDTPSDDNSPTAQYSHQNLLTVPSHHRFERQVSEPILPLSSSISVIGGPIGSSGEARQGASDRSHSHLLPVPTSHQQPYLVKQHSHPLLPSQTSAGVSHSTAAGGTYEPLQAYTLQRQLSHPNTGHRDSSAPLTLVTSSSGSTHYLTPSSSLKTDSDEEVGGGGLPTTVIPKIQLQSALDRSGPTVVIVPADPVNTPTTSSSVSVVSNASEQQSTLTTITSTPTSTIRVKSEELSRSISTPLTSSRSTDIPGLDNPRSSHCPVVREGPALGCNFCWNTIDAHGRILRRKTKYHCPECQTNLCIVPCFQEYHERQAAENPTPTNDSGGSGGGSGLKSNLRHYAKSGSM